MCFWINSTARQPACARTTASSGRLRWKFSQASSRTTSSACQRFPTRPTWKAHGSTASPARSRHSFPPASFRPQRLQKARITPNRCCSSEIHKCAASLSKPSRITAWPRAGSSTCSIGAGPSRFGISAGNRCSPPCGQSVGVPVQYGLFSRGRSHLLSNFTRLRPLTCGRRETMQGWTDRLMRVSGDRLPPLSAGPPKTPPTSMKP